jgi:hypothetical protein
MNHNVGSTIDSPRVGGSTSPRHLSDTKQLPNGNSENKYEYRGTCFTYFEFNPETKIIVGWHSEGTDQDCEIEQ